MKTDRLELVAAGDAIVNRRLSRHDDKDAFHAVVEPIRSADASVVNLETPLHDHDGYPAAHTSGYLSAPPWAVDELTWAGFDMYAAATNHAADGGHQAIEATLDALDQRHLPYTGLGRSLTDARRPAYVETPAGRVALVAVSSTIQPGAHAGPASAEMPARPGIAPLRVTAEYTVPDDWYEQLETLSEQLGLEQIKEWRADAGIPTDEDGFTLLNANALAFTNADEFHLQFDVGEEFAIERHPYQPDLDALREQIQRADQQADWVLASVHSHEGEGARINDASVPGFLERVAHECVDAGADAFFAHGAHTLRGIELYDGAPVFYGLGNLLAHIETVERLPPSMYAALGLDTHSDSAAEVYDRLDIHDEEQYWESVLPRCWLTSDGVEEITLLPLELGHDRSRGQRGTPLRAAPDHGEVIVERLAELSEEYETSITFEDGRGQIVPQSSAD